MKDLAIVKVLASGLAKTKFALRKNSPEIFLFLGIAGGAACAVLTGIASTKVLGIVDDAKEEIAVIKELAQEDLEADPESACTPEETSREVSRVYLRTGLQVAKLYTPAACAGLIALGSTLISHKIVTKRNVALGAALLTVSEGFKEYRDRVRDRLGEATERDIRDGVVEKTVTNVVVDETTGKEKKVKSTIKVLSDPNLSSQYSVYFDRTCIGWEERQDYREMFLNAQQSYANDKLRADRFLFLNDVCDMLGIEKTEAGQVVGWTYNLGNSTGDNYVDFRAHDVHREILLPDGTLSYETVTVLDFNCDGDIYKIKPFSKAKRS